MKQKVSSLCIAVNKNNCINFFHFDLTYQSGSNQKNKNSLYLIQMEFSKNSNWLFNNPGDEEAATFKQLRVRWPRKQEAAIISRLEGQRGDQGMCDLVETGTLAEEIYHKANTLGFLGFLGLF